ncbi:MAG: hypothetical protein JWM10_5388, partial [Myxococcaceae bacterium]|nr:hypothetical protein [Myxococcaceae bacterium]
DPMPSRPSMPDPMPSRPSMPAYAPPVHYAPTAPEMATFVPPSARPVAGPTALTDVARHGAFVRAAADAKVQQDSTMALDLASLDPATYGQLGAPHPAASLFGESFDGGSDLDPSVGTQVMSQGLGGGTEPPAPFDDVPPPDAANTTRAIDTAEAFAQLDAYARRKPPPEAMATLKAPVRTAGGFNPVAPRNDPSRNPDLRATNQMAQARPATLAPNGFISAAAAIEAAGDPFAGGSFAGDPFAGSSTPSAPPVEPTMAVPIEAMMAGAHLPYGNAAQAMPALRPSMPDPLVLPPMHTAFAMGAPPRETESLPARPPSSTILGQPAWIMITIAVLIVVSVGASAFLLAGGR